MTTVKKSSVAQAGSVFFYILLGVVLFGALAFTVSRGMRSQSTNALTERQIDLAVDEILANAQTLARGVDTLRQRGVSESDLCFAHAQQSNTNRTAYLALPGCAQDANKLFDAAGAGVPYFSVPADWLEAGQSAAQGFGEWMFTNTTAVAGLGAGALSQPSSVEVIAHINHIRPEICTAINAKLGMSGIPNNGGAFRPASPMTGPFLAQGEINAAALSGKKSGCFQNSNTWPNYIFYTVLLERD